MGECSGCGLGEVGTVEGVGIVCIEMGIEAWEMDRSGTIRTEGGGCWELEIGGCV